LSQKVRKKIGIPEAQTKKTPLNLPHKKSYHEKKIYEKKSKIIKQETTKNLKRKEAKFDGKK